MDQQDLSRIKISRCCAGINNPKCRRSQLRNLSPTMIEHIRAMGYSHQLDETMHICESCRLVIRLHRSPPKKKRRSGGCEVNQNPQPPTSGQASNEMLGKINLLCSTLNDNDCLHRTHINILIRHYCIFQKQSRPVHLCHPSHQRMNY